MKKGIFQKYMLRPMLYMTFTRLMTALIFLLAIDRFVKNGPALSMTSGFLAAFFALCAYLVYLRMDGLRVPRMKFIRFKKKKDPIRIESSMADHIDEEAPVSFDELEEDERDFISFVSALINFIVFTAASFII
ncbi:MAG: hypothetical protein IKJ65_07435 [Clostridia bacterium]|nr:hypothetical protein [Clostridia bacterium]